MASLAKGYVNLTVTRIYTCILKMHYKNMRIKILFNSINEVPVPWLAIDLDVFEKRYGKKIDNKELRVCELHLHALHSWWQTKKTRKQQLQDNGPIN